MVRILNEHGQRALHALRGNGRAYYVRPAGTVGTCGWVNGRPWTVVTVLAHSPEDAIRACEVSAEFRKLLGV